MGRPTKWTDQKAILQDEQDAVHTLSPELSRFTKESLPARDIDERREELSKPKARRQNQKYDLLKGPDGIPRKPGDRDKWNGKAGDRKHIGGFFGNVTLSQHIQDCTGVNSCEETFQPKIGERPKYLLSFVSQKGAAKGDKKAKDFLAGLKVFIDGNQEIDIMQELDPMNEGSMQLDNL